MQPMLLYPRRSRFAPKYEVGKEGMKKNRFTFNLSQFNGFVKEIAPFTCYLFGAFFVKIITFIVRKM